MTSIDSSQNRVESLYGTSSDEETQRSAFTNSDVAVAVYGLGKMGLPLASVFAETCGNVTGVDIDPDVVHTIQQGDCHVQREPGLKALVSELVAEGALRATTKSRAAAEQSSVHVVIVPTPITEENEPDLAVLDAVVSDIATGLTEGDLVLIECTVPPSTTRSRVYECLLNESDLRRGEFGVAFCPERTSSGRALKDIRGAYPKVVGGVDNESARAATVIYREINEEGVLVVSDATTAEAVKIFEGVYRDVNIALANELGRFTDELGINVREAIRTANTQPFCDIHDPGPGVGGHCIPYYPYFLIKPFKTPTPLLSTAREVNDSMPEFTVSKVLEGLNAIGTTADESTIVILGLTYRPGVNEVRASPSIPIINKLNDLGAQVYGVDPLLDTFDTFNAVSVTQEEIYDLNADGYVLVTPHEDFQTIRWEELCNDTNEPCVVIDGRSAIETPDLNGWIYTIGGNLSG